MATDTIKVYHNPRCSKSRMAVNYLNSKSIAFETVLYLDTKLSVTTIKDILNKLNCAPLDLMRKGEAIYKSVVKDKNLSESQLIDMLIKYPNLIERPIIIKGKRALIARPTELIDSIL